MTRPRVAVVTVLVAAGLLIVVVVAAAAWVLYTPSGFAWLAARASSYAGKGLTIDAVAGTLAEHGRIGALHYAGENIEIDVREAEFAISPRSLLRLKPPDPVSTRGACATTINALLGAYQRL